MQRVAEELFVVVIGVLFVGCGWSESEDYFSGGSDQGSDNSETDSDDGTDSMSGTDSDLDAGLDGSTDETCGEEDTEGTCGGGDSGPSDPFDTDSDTDLDGGTSPYDSFCGDPRFVVFTRTGGREFRKEDVPFKGRGDEVVIDGFSNFYCSHCRAASEVFRNIFSNEAYSDRTVYYFHHFGWGGDMSQPSWDAHRAAYAAFRQGYFWEMHDAIFDSDMALYQNDLYAVAQEFSKAPEFDLAQYAWDYSSPEAEEYLERDLLDGQDAGVYGTPTVFVNGYSLIPWTDVEELLDCLFGYSGDGR